jgi:hypothetical protein
MNILQALADPKLLGSAALAGLSDGSVRLPMSGKADADLFRQCTGRSELPVGPYSEAWLVCGRRAGISFLLALIAAYLAAFPISAPSNGQRPWWLPQIASRRT